MADKSEVTNIESRQPSDRAHRSIDARNVEIAPARARDKYFGKLNARAGSGLTTGGATESSVKFDVSVEVTVDVAKILWRIVLILFLLLSAC